MFKNLLLHGCTKSDLLSENLRQPICINNKCTIIFASVAIVFIHYKTNHFHKDVIRSENSLLASLQC